MRAKSLLYGPLVERWWNTTNSFNFTSIGELTLTPYDFSMLTGLRVGVSGPIPCDPDMTHLKVAERQLLGVIPDITNHRMVRYSWFYNHFSKAQLATPDEVAQYTRGFLMYLLGTTLFANRENIVGLYLLGALAHLLQVTEYNWGGADLATLYCYMCSVSRHKADSHDGCWRVWEVSRSIYVAAWHAFTMRILFEGPFSQAYYLEERFIRHTRGVANPDIPHPPLPIMKVVDELQDGPQIDLLMLGEIGNRHHKPDDFTIFLHTRVMAPLTPGMARTVPEVAVAATAASDTPAGGALAVAPIPGFLVIPVKIMCIRSDGVIEQIPLERIEERDRRLVFAPSIEQVYISLCFYLLHFVLFSFLPFLFIVLCYLYLPFSNFVPFANTPGVGKWFGNTLLIHWDARDPQLTT
ncbi:hypothetical protein ACSBR2_015179 [Camellia fascicularis]